MDTTSGSRRSGGMPDSKNSPADVAKPILTFKGKILPTSAMPLSSQTSSPTSSSSSALSGADVVKQGQDARFDEIVKKFQISLGPVSALSDAERGALKSKLKSMTVESLTAAGEGSGQQLISVGFSKAMKSAKTISPALIQAELQMRSDSVTKPGKFFIAKALAFAKAPTRESAKEVEQHLRKIALDPAVLKDIQTQLDNPDFVPDKYFFDDAMQAVEKLIAHAPEKQLSSLIESLVASLIPPRAALDSKVNTQSLSVAGPSPSKDFESLMLQMKEVPRAQVAEVRGKLESLSLAALYDAPSAITELAPGFTMSNTAILAKIQQDMEVQYCAEPAIFMSKSATYKAEPSRAQAHALFNEFVKAGSPQQVNISDGQVKQILINIKAAENKENELPPLEDEATEAQIASDKEIRAKLYVSVFDLGRSEISELMRIQNRLVNVTKVLNAALPK